METKSHTTPSAWVGCLGCYNNGRLVGKWLEGEAIGDTVAAGLATLETVGDYTAPRCRRCFADEFWVFDHEGMLGLIQGECSPSEAAEAAATVEEIEREGIDLEAAAAFIEDRGAWDSDEFQDSYAGEWDSLEEFAQHLAEDTGALSDSVTWPYTCIDWERAAFELSFDYSILGGGYVFRH
jgi:antirestriction protein